MVVLLDGVEIRVVRKRRLRKEVPRISPEVGIVPQHPEIHAKDVEIRNVKLHEGDIQADVGLRDVVAEQEPVAGKPLINRSMELQKSSNASS